MDGGRAVGGRRARGARERDGRARRLRQPEREEAAAALVDVRAGADARLAREREHQRRRARARRGARVLEAAARELVGEGAQAEIGVRGGHRPRVMPADLLLLHGFTQTGASWDGVVRALGDASARSRPTWARGHGRRSSTASTRSRRRAFALAGYSMGGRLALGFALRRPERVRAARARLGVSPGSPTRGSAPRGGRPTRRSRNGSRRSAPRRSRASGRPSRCSQAARRGRRARPRGPAAALGRRARGAAARPRHRRDAAAVGPARRAARCP